MTPHYRHTQIGWVILAALAAVFALVWVRLPPEAVAAARYPLLLVAALLLLVFSALTVEVDDAALRLRFGIGLVRKRIPLAEVRAWRVVRNPWITGWGIRLGPGYVLWNVSGREAVELDFASGRRFRVGTDEPEALVSAIERGKGEAMPAPAAPGEWRPVEPAGSVAWKGWAIAFALVGAVFGGIFWSQLRPPRVTVTHDGFEVDTLFYGDSFEAKDISAVSLEARLPPVRWRSNGFAGAGTLRGQFQVEGLGGGRLYVEEGFAPYVLVRLRRSFVVINYHEPERTQALYDTMARAWPERVVSAAP